MAGNCIGTDIKNSASLPQLGYNVCMHDPHAPWWSKWRGDVARRMVR
jgi:hypothetical protein